MRSDGINVIRCSHCGMGVAEKYPADLKFLYSDAYYQATGAWDQGYANYSYTAEHGVAWAASLISLLAPHGRTLDIGCADGHLLKKLRSTHECYGIEVNARMADQCSSGGIKIIGFDVFDEAINTRYNAFFDVVSAVAVFEHLPDLRSAVRIALSLLQPDGILLFEVPLISAQHPSDVWFKSSLEHVYYPTEGSLRYLIERVFKLPLIGGEVVISDYASTFVGMVPKNASRGTDLAKEYRRLTSYPIEGLKNAEERRFRFLFDCLHAARLTPAHLRLLDSIQPSEISPAFLGRLADLWRRDTERLTESRNHLVAAESDRDWHVNELRKRNEVVDRLESELVAKDGIIESIRSELAVRDEIIGEREKELQIFRTSKSSAPAYCASARKVLVETIN